MNRRPSWLIPAAVLGLLALVVVIVLVVGGGGDDGDGEADGDGTTTTAPAPPSEVELELVDIDLAQASTPADELGSGDLTVALVPGTARVTGDLVVLDDDREAMAPEPIVPVARLDVAFPELEVIFQDISEALTTDALAGLVAFSSAEGSVVEDVVTSWLATNDLAEPEPIEAPGPIRIQASAGADLRVAAFVYGEVLLAAGFDVEYLEAAAAPADLVTAIRDRTADLVLGGGSTLLVAFGGAATPLTPADELRTAITTAAEGVAGTALVPAAADRALRLLTSAATADELGLGTITDLARASGRQPAGATPGCSDDPFCQPLLESSYGLRFTE